MITECILEVCDRPRGARNGLCAAHNSRLKRTGDVQADKPIVARVVRIGTEQCSVEGCDRPEKRRNWCTAHYGRWLRTGDVMADQPIVDRYDGPCIIANCPRPVIARKLCSLHYGRNRDGTPLEQPLRIVQYRDERRTTDGLIVCTECRLPKSESEFRDGKLQCIECLNRKSLSYQRSDPRARRDRKLRYSYNKTIEWYEETFAQQKGLCDSCHRPETHVAKDGTSWLAVDHDHSCCPGVRSCGECVRGLLCRSCNQGLGLFDDDSALLSAAIDYLDKWSTDARRNLSPENICRTG